MALTLEYTIDLDHRVWIPIPLSFPWNGYQNDEHWAADLAGSLLDGFDAGAEVEQQLQRTALALARVTGPLPGAIERFWHFPEFGGLERLVHLYISEVPEAREKADLGNLARAGIGGFVQVLAPLDGTSFARAARAVVITATGEDEPLYVERYIGLAGGLVFILELIESNAFAVEELEAPLESLFRSIRLQERA
ncbi:hypothetical protein J7E25_16555 [Agromyces sp. ISL-38]|uniref:hypothetical protein n=1 Tax=Agromyces sp. ISL-38 TaxID=2819107 RepID=UPI001BE87C87|nr:hypothetical protein [Agromyces sp. ISL-38]MBT2500708.1 hypothetical protein [Agromyces sp. ISL-38]MBT2516695.1 hypothetical protein [Streptomyces sp. ISL-90]